MARKKADPAVLILKFFEDAIPEVRQLMYALIGAKINPAPKPEPKKRVKKAETTEAS